MRKPKPVSRGSPYATGGSIAVTALLAFTLFALSKPSKEIEKAERVEPVQKQASVILANAAVSLPPPPTAAPPEPDIKVTIPEKVKKAETLKETSALKEAAKREEPAKEPPSQPGQKQTQEKKVKPIPQTVDRREATKKGRATLKLLEHGKKEMVHLVWPDHPGEMDQLYLTLKNRLGMQTVLVDEDYQLYTKTGAPGIGKPIDRDRFSTILRSPEGALPPSELKIEKQLLRRHSNGNGALILARIFPRNSDAMLLGGIEQLREKSGDAQKNNRFWITLVGDRLKLSDKKGNEILLLFK